LINPSSNSRPRSWHGSAEDWLAAFEPALASRHPAQIRALFHQDCYWRDVLAFTWLLTPLQGWDTVAARLAAEQGRTAARGFHLPPGRRQPRKVKRLGIDSVEAIFEFKTADGSGAGIIVGFNAEKRDDILPVLDRWVGFMRGF
jgi:hypothetical protein